MIFFDPKPSCDVKHWTSHPSMSRQAKQIKHSLHTFVSSPIGLSGSESLLQCEKEVGEPTSEAGGVGSSLFTSACPSTSMATRSLRDSENKEWWRKPQIKKTSSYCTRTGSASSPHQKKVNYSAWTEMTICCRAWKRDVLSAYCFSVLPFWESCSPVWVSGWPAAGSGCSRWLSSALQTCWATKKRTAFSIKQCHSAM